MEVISRKPMIVAGLFSVTLLVVFLAQRSFLIRSTPLRVCGHERNVWNELNPFGATHCCYAGSLVSELCSIHSAQRTYEGEHGIFATQFSQLTNEYGLWASKRSRLYEISILTNGYDWSLVVPRSQYLPGHYLMTSDGRLYFREDTPATTNDSLLSHAR